MKKQTIIVVVVILTVLLCFLLGIRGFASRSNHITDVQEEVKSKESIIVTAQPEPTQSSEEREQPSDSPVTTEETADDNNLEEDENDSTPSTEEGTIEIAVETEEEPYLPIEMPGFYISGENDLEEDVFD